MRARKAFAVCYPDSTPDIDSALSALSPDAYAYILHDADVDVNAELKKPHYHVYLEFENAREFSVLGSVLGCGENNVEKVKSTRGSIRYLVHADSPEKHQYNISDICVCNLDIDKFFVLDNEAAQVAKILAIIDELKTDSEPHTFSEVVSRVCSARCYSTFRRGQSIFVNVWRFG